MVDGYPLMLNASDGYTSPYYWINESYSLIWVYTIIYPPTFDHVTTTSIRRCEKDVPWRPAPCVRKKRSMSISASFKMINGDILLEHHGTSWNQIKSAIVPSSLNSISNHRCNPWASVKLPKGMKQPRFQSTELFQK